MGTHRHGSNTDSIAKELKLGAWKVGNIEESQERVSEAKASMCLSVGPCLLICTCSQLMESWRSRLCGEPPTSVSRPFSYKWDILFIIKDVSPRYPSNERPEGPCSLS